MKKLIATLWPLITRRRFMAAQPTLDELDELIDREILRDPMIAEPAWDELDRVNRELAAIASNNQGVR